MKNTIKKKIIVSVTNDLATDQRVHKTCSTLNNMGFEILLVGRRLPNSPKVSNRNYNHHRMKLIFTKGALFYAEYNIRLFFFLLFNKFDIVTSNDLDTLLANFLASKIKRKPIVYDSHEYFTEVPEIVNRPLVQKIWKIIEQLIFPKLEYIFTVNNSIATLFENKYNKRPVVVRNIPFGAKLIQRLNRNDLKLPNNKFILILQGSGINIHRGAEEAVEAMKYIENAILLIIGDGDVINILKEMTTKMSISEKVVFIPRIEYSTLMQYTLNSDIGLTLDKDTNVNYRYSLPNKLFDYIRAGIPILSSDLVETKKLILKYNIGDIIPNHNPNSIADKINYIMKNTDKIEEWKENAKNASDVLTWENEAKNIIEVYEKLL